MTSQFADKLVEPLLKRLMVPLLSALLLLVIGFFIAQSFLHQRQLHISNAQFIDNTLRTLQLTLENQIQLFIALEKLILTNPDLLSILKYQQREKLLQAFAPEYQRLLDSQGITHFYFHKVDGFNLVRLHNPQRYGDRIERQTFKQAQLTSKRASGLEMGPTGDFALRVVSPVFDDDGVIGYLEIGKDIETIVPSLKNLENVDLALYIYKHGLQRQLWEQNHANHQHHAQYSWNLFDDYILTYTSNPAIVELLEHFHSHENTESGHSHFFEDTFHFERTEITGGHEQSQSYQIELDHKPTLLTILPLKDVSGKARADLILLHDVSQPTRNFHYWIGITAAASLLITLILAGFLFRFLKRVDLAIASQRLELLDSSDRLAKARSVTNDGIWEWNLQTQQVIFDERYYTMAGYAAGEFPSSFQSWQDHIHPDDLDLAVKTAKDFREGNLDKYDIEFRFRRKDGSYMWIRSRAKVFARDEAGKPLRIVGTHTNVTRRKNIQDSLIKSEQSYRMLVENQSDLVVEVDRDGRFLFVSPSYCQLFGKTEEELIGKTFMPLVHEDDRETTARAMEALHHPPYSCYLEQRAMTADGWHWLGWQDNAIVDDDGQVLSIIGVGRDITVRRQMETQLRESEEKFSKAFYQQDIAMELVDLDQATRLEINDKYCEITGYSREELLNSNIYDKNLWLNPKDQLQAVKQLRTLGTISEVPMDITDKSGQSRNLLLSAAKLDLESQQNIVIATLIDITQLRAAEQALKESEARFRIAFNQQYQFICILDADGVALEVNDLPLKVGKIRREQVIGKPFWQAAFWENMPEIQQVWQERFAALKKDFQPIHSDEPFMDSDGGIHYTESTTSAILDNQHNLKFILIEATEVTERRKAEKQRDELLEKVQELNVNLELRVKKRTAELKAVNKELEAFAYSVSHDLRAPLRSIDGFSQALIEDYAEKLDEKGHDYLNRVRNAAQRMGQLIDDLLQLSRVNRNEIHLQQIDLADLAEQVLEDLRHADPDRKVDVRLGKGLMVEGDPRLLQVMLVNLLGNAWKFTAQQDQARITFDRSKQKPDVFFVKDNGVGFEMRHADKLFGAFQRLHHAREFPGTGVGLATVQRILHRHGGEIWAEAELGKGATFYFSLAHSKKPKAK